MNNHLVGKTDILEPRAKIGDVVIVKLDVGTFQLTVTHAEQSITEWLYTLKGRQSDVHKRDKDILRNLTTNVSYE